MFAAVKQLQPKRDGAVTVEDMNGKRILNNEGKAKVVAKHFQQQLGPATCRVIEPFEGIPRPLDCPITQHEAAHSFRRLKNGRACGPDELPAELLKYSGPATAKLISSILNNVFETHQGIEVGKGTLIPLQKPGKPKGPTANLRPIILLPSLRKSLSLVILNRIRPGVEKYLSPGQSGFRRNRSTADVVWCKRWLSSIVERFSAEIHVLGLDFSKAFDTVNREKLLQVLRSEQIANDDEVRIIRYLMANTTLEVKIESFKSPAFPTTKGIPQGDGLSPVLFTVYLEAALRDLRSSLPPRPTADAQIPPETAYADDADFISTSHTYLRQLLALAEDIFDKWDLKVNVSKTEWVRMYLEPVSETTVHRGQEQWRSIRTLGSLFGTAQDVTRRIGLSAVAFGRMKAIWFRRQHLQTNTMVRLYNAYVLPILTYNIGCAGLSKALEDSVDKIHRKQLRHMLGIFYPRVVSNDDLYELAHTEPISAMAKRARWRLLGHILRQPSSTPGNQAMIKYASMEDAVRHRRGAPRSCLVTTLQQDVKFTAVALKTSRHLETLRSCAVDRQKWSNICSAVV